MIENFAEKLKQKRKELGLTQTEAADAIPISLRQYQKYERDLMPPWDVLEKIEAAFGFSFMNLKDEPKRHNKAFIISQRHLLI